MPHLNTLTGTCACTACTSQFLFSVLLAPNESFALPPSLLHNEMFPFNKFFIPKYLLACRLQCKEQLVKNLKNLSQLYTALQRMKTLVFAIIVSMILGSLILRTGLHYHTHGYMDLEEFAIITTSLLLPIWTFFHKMVELFYADLRPRRQLFNRRDRSRG